MKLQFIQDRFFKNMDCLYLDNVNQHVSIPRGLFEMLPKDKIDLVNECITETFKAGFLKGQQMKSEEIQALLNKLKKI